MTEFEERCHENKFEIMDASDGIDQENALEIDSKTGLFKIDINGDFDDHEFKLRMTLLDMARVNNNSPKLMMRIHLNQEKLCEEIHTYMYYFFSNGFIVDGNY